MEKFFGHKFIWKRKLSTKMYLKKFLPKIGRTLKNFLRPRLRLMKFSHAKNLFGKIFHAMWKKVFYPKCVWKSFLRHDLCKKIRFCLEFMKKIFYAGSNKIFHLTVYEENFLLQNSFTKFSSRNLFEKNFLWLVIHFKQFCVICLEKILLLQNVSGRNLLMQKFIYENFLFLNTGRYLMKHFLRQNSFEKFFILNTMCEHNFFST